MVLTKIPAYAGQGKMHCPVYTGILSDNKNLQEAFQNVLVNQRDSRVWQVKFTDKASKDLTPVFKSKLNMLDKNGNAGGCHCKNNDLQKAIKEYEEHYDFIQKYVQTNM